MDDKEEYEHETAASTFEIRMRSNGKFSTKISWEYYFMYIRV